MKILQLLLAITVTILLSCTAVQTSGTSSDIDIELIGVAAVDAQPISNAVVSLSDESDSSLVAVTLSDESGTYRFSGVQAGRYYLEASLTPQSGDSVKGSLSNIAVNSDDSLVELDTLWMQRPGAIHGSINLNGGTGTVLIYIPGTSYAAHTDGSGDFLMTGVWPDSNYTVKFECDGFSSVQISDLTVLSGDTLQLSPQSLTANSTPINVRAAYDTAANTVTLSWDRMLRDDVTGYIVVRKEDPQSSAMSHELNDYLLGDTFFVDTLKDELFSQISNDSSLTLRYNILGETAEGRTGYSKAVDIEAVITRDSSDEKRFLSVTPDTVGMVLKGLTATTISWQYRGLMERVKLELTTDGGKTWDPIAYAVPNTGSYLWPRVDNVESDQCQIRISSVEYPEYSKKSEFFSIEMIAGVEILANGSFADGNAEWVESIITTENTANPINATFSTEDGLFKSSVTSCDPKSMWMIRIGQIPPYPLYKNYTYELRIKAKSSIPTTMFCSFASYDNGNRFYGQIPVSIDTAWNVKTYRFSLTEYNHVDTTIVDDPVSEETYFFMNFGYEPADIWVDDVSLTVVAIKE